MKIKRLIIFSIITGLFSCNYFGIKSHHNDSFYKKLNPSVRWLVDSAIGLGNSMIPMIYDSAYNKKDTDSVYNITIPVFNAAIKLDTTYFSDWQKLTFQLRFKKDSAALVTAIEMRKFKPDWPLYNFITGMLYEKMNDSTAARAYFQKSIAPFNKMIDTMSDKTKKQPLSKVMEIDRAVDLVMLGQQQNGNKLLQKIYANEVDTSLKKIEFSLINKSKKEILANPPLSEVSDFGYPMRVVSDYT